MFDDENLFLMLNVNVEYSAEFNANIKIPLTQAVENLDICEFRDLAVNMYLNPQKKYFISLDLINKDGKKFGTINTAITSEYKNVDVSIKEFVFRCLFSGLKNSYEENIKKQAGNIVKKVLGNDVLNDFSWNRYHYETPQIIEYVRGEIMGRFKTPNNNTQVSRGG